MGYLIDTCIWVDVERGRIAPADVYGICGEEPVFISPVTIAELTFGLEMSKNDAIKNKRIAALEKLKKKPILYIDELTGDIFGKVTAGIFKAGKGMKYRIQDLWIACQALQYNYFLLTGNIKDFKDIPGLKLVPYK